MASQPEMTFIPFVCEFKKSAGITNIKIIAIEIEMFKT